MVRYRYTIEMREGNPQIVEGIELKLGGLVYMIKEDFLTMIPGLSNPRRVLYIKWSAPYECVKLIRTEVISDTEEENV